MIDSCLYMPEIHPAWNLEVTIRQLNQADLPALEWEGEFAHFRNLFRDIFQQTNQGRALMWGVEIPGTGIIGQLFVQLDSNRKELADGFSTAYFFGLRIKTPFQSAGIGGRLLNIAEKDLVKRLYQRATLNVSRQNPNARRFYENRGYRVIAHEPGHWSYLDEKGQQREVHEPALRMMKDI